MRTLASAPERSVGTRNVEGEPLLATTHIDGSVFVRPAVGARPNADGWPHRMFMSGGEAATEPAFGTPVNDSGLSQKARLQARSRTPACAVRGRQLPRPRPRAGPHPAQIRSADHRRGSLPPLPCILNRKNAARGQIATAERLACQWLLGKHNGLRVPKSEAALECHSEPLDPGVGPVRALSFPGAPLLIVASSTPTRSITQSKSGGSARNIPALAISA